MPYCFDQSTFLTIQRTSYSNPIHFLFSGKLIYRKGFDILIEAIAILTKLNLQFQVVIIGDGPEKKLMGATSPQVQVHINYRGFIELSERKSVYAACDVLICPSRYDGWGMVVPEGMAAGMPVISTAMTGAANDAIKHGVNGFLMQSCDPAILATYMSFFINNPNNILPMGNAARETVAQYSSSCGASKIIARTMTLFA